MAAGLDGAQLLVLIAIGQVKYSKVALLKSGATYCFLSERIAQPTGLHLDISTRLDVCLVDGEQCACLLICCY